MVFWNIVSPSMFPILFVQISSGLNFPLKSAQRLTVIMNSGLPISVSGSIIRRSAVSNALAITAAAAAS